MRAGRRLMACLNEAARADGVRPRYEIAVYRGAEVSMRPPARTVCDSWFAIFCFQRAPSPVCPGLGAGAEDCDHRRREKCSASAFAWQSQRVSVPSRAHHGFATLCQPPLDGRWRGNLSQSSLGHRSDDWQRCHFTYRWPACARIDLVLSLDKDQPACHRVFLPS